MYIVQTYYTYPKFFGYSSNYSLVIVVSTVFGYLLDGNTSSILAAFVADTGEKLCVIHVGTGGNDRIFSV
jgi:hypothetical protein